MAAEERKGEAGRTSLTLDRDLGSRIGVHLASRSLEPAASLGVPIAHHEYAWANGEDVAAKGDVLVMGHLDHTNSSLGQILQ